MTWAKELTDSREIAEYVAQNSPYDVCEEQIEELFRECRAVLEWRELATLTHGNADGNTPDATRQAACDAMDLDKMPPLLVERGEIQDGNHRLRALRKRGVTHFWIYDIREI